MTPGPAWSEEPLPWAFGGPPLTGLLRERPEDFQVDEALGFDLDGEGPHVFLHVRKTGLNTEQVARQLGHHARVPLMAVGYAGLKDRHAVTRQWFSVELGGRPEPDWTTLDGPALEVLSVRRHRRKLRRGALKGNRFQIRVRAPEGERALAETRLTRLATAGVPNYFGPQRFGRDQDNLTQAERLFRGELGRITPHLRGLYLSAARSHLFNQVLSERVAQGTWDQALPGDLMQLDGSHSWFALGEPDPTIQRRLAEQDIHPTGPLWGRGELESGGAVADLERAVAGRFPLWCQGLDAFGLKQERRALRLPVRELAWDWDGAGDLILGFFLPAGGFATTVLRELLSQPEMREMGD